MSDEPTGVVTVREGAAASATPAAPPPSSVDRYVLDREIAQGGMGRIFAARDVRLGRPVAIKVLLEASETAARRFEREARLAARLQHPGIVTVYDAGFWPTGEPFLVMRLVPGRSLERAIADADTLEDRLALLPTVIAATDALAYAHDQGIVHRDLKPGNVLVGVFGETVVIDWGLAKDLDAGEPEATGANPQLNAPSAGSDLTHDGAVLGTPAFMAPEQAEGKPVDARADVWALGAILYHVLAGAPPAAAGGSVRLVEPGVPMDLAAIVAQAMARDPAARYPTAFELGEDLKRFATGQLVAARQYSAMELARRWVRRHPLAAAVIGVIAALGILRALGR